MRSSIADALFPHHRQRILSTLLINPDRSWYLSDLAHELKTTSSSLQREMASLTEAGVLTKRLDGNRTYYQADPECPVFLELREFFVKTSGFVDQVRAALEPFDRQIQVAFIYGSVAEGRERNLSDVDLLVIGRARLIELASALKPIENRLGRPINFSVYSKSEFAAKLESGNHFLSAVLDSSKLFIIGSERDLASIANLRSRKVASNDKVGA